jgi:adenosylhomocysteine nucleosidase
VSGPSAAGAPVLFVVGMVREAKILGPRRRVLVGTAGLDAVLRERPSALVSFGLCGALAPELEVGQLVMATAVVTPDGELPADETLSGRLADRLGPLVRGLFVGSDVIVPDPPRKSALRRSSGAIATDMESHLAAQAAARAGVPFAALRAVSDRADEALPAAAQAGFRPDGGVDVAAVVAGLARRPADLPGLLRTARHAGAAFAALRRAAEALDDA